MRSPLVPGRWPVAALAAGGVLLALPTLIWPVLVITSLNPDNSDFSSPKFAQGQWSWGKFAELSQTHGGTSSELSSTPSLVLLVVR